MNLPYELHRGDCREVMATMATDSVDAVVTDPPYGLSFMGREWDHGVPGVPFWTEALRVAKPGAHLVAFGGSRTFHRLVCAVEDAGWEVRDVLMWLYGSGFPKSLDVSKAIDKEAGATREVIGTRLVSRDFSAGVGEDVAFRSGRPGLTSVDVTAPATTAVRQWSGWGTALKPAYEPIILARKPLRGTVARNVQTYGTGAVNVDGCRLPHASTDDLATSMSKNPGRGDTVTSDVYGGGRPQQSVNTNGRWPANILLDEAAAAELDAMAPSASRFFYTSKASGEDRARWAGNDHPTVKPTDLMRWLCRLVTPPGGLILDPFMGSGSTGVAAVEEGFRFVGIDLEERHVDIARRRLAHGARQPGLFD